MSNKTTLQTNNSALSANNVDLQSLIDQANSLPDAGSSIEQATPEISVDSSSGLITATAGTKSSTYQLAFQAAKTITPTTASQIAVSSGYYTGGNITVAAIPSSYVIPSGTLTISANGTHDVKNYASAVVSVESSGSGEGYDEADSLVTRNFTSYTNSRVTSIGSHAFYNCESLTSIIFPKCTNIGSNAFNNCFKLATTSFPVCINIAGSAFYSCSSLTTASFPACTSIGNYAFSGCTNLTSVSFPVCTSIGGSAFAYCYNLTSVSFPVCTSIGNGTFRNCSSLTSVFFPVCTSISNYTFGYCSSLTSASFPKCTNIGSSAFYRCRTLSTLTLGASTVCTLANSNAFSSTPYAGYSGFFSGTPYIYVPSSLVASYKAATNWTYFSSYFSSIESLDGGANLISFTIDGTEYQAEEGMTWAEWVESEYNVGNFHISNRAVTSSASGGNSVCNSMGFPVNSSEIISNNEAYKLS